MKTPFARSVCRCLPVLFAVVLLPAGCKTPLGPTNSQSPDDVDQVTDDIQLVGDVALPFGTGSIEVEGVGLVVDLPGTGSDPVPTMYRAMLETELRKRQIKDPIAIMASKNTALVLVRGTMQPGAQKSDKFDLEVRVPSRSETRSLQGGRLMPVRLVQTAVANGQVHEGNLLASGDGPVLIDPSVDAKENPQAATRGRVLGGGTCLKSHSLGLVLKPDFQRVKYAYLVGQATNLRFHSYNHGVRADMANPKTDEFIELKVHPRYRDNVQRYLQIVRALPLQETSAQRVARIVLLKRQLLDPLTASRAATKLEAIGHEGVTALVDGLKSPDLEVQFYSAEALAYLDYEESSAAAVSLAEAARSEPAFRVFALTALSAMNDGEAYDQLRQLMNLPSAETRYGAFRALWAMNENDPLVRGETLGGQFSYHRINSTGPPMIHVTRSYRPEMVLFGHDQQFVTPLILEAGQNIMIKAESGGPVEVSKFMAGQPDQKRQVSNKVDDVIRAVVELGGTYPDVVMMLQQAAQSSSLANHCRLEVDAVPQPGRTYVRAGESDQQGRDFVVTNPLPNLFSADAKRSRRGSSKSKKDDDEEADESSKGKKDKDNEKKGGIIRRAFAKITPGED